MQPPKKSLMDGKVANRIIFRYVCISQRSPTITRWVWNPNKFEHGWVAPTSTMLHTHLYQLLINKTGTFSSEHELLEN